MSIALRISLLCILTLGVFYAWWWLVVPLAIWQVLRYSAYELVVVALLIDVYYGTPLLFPYYTLAAALAVFLGLLTQPLLRPRVSRSNTL